MQTVEELLQERKERKQIEYTFFYILAPFALGMFIGFATALFVNSY